MLKSFVLNREFGQFLFVLCIFLVVTGWLLPLAFLGYVATTPYIALGVSVVGLLIWIINKETYAR